MSTDQISGMRDWAPPALALTLVIPTLHMLGSGPLAAPPLHEAGNLDRWFGEGDAIVIAFSILRLGALLVAYHLAVVLLLAATGRMLRRRSLITLARRLTPSLYRGMIERIAGIGLSTTILIGAPIPVSADAPTSTTVAEHTVADQTVDEPSGTATMRLDPPTGRAELRLLDPPSDQRESSPPARPAEPIPVDGDEPVQDPSSSTTATPPTDDLASTTEPVPTTGSVPPTDSASADDTAPTTRPGGTSSATVGAAKGGGAPSDAGSTPATGEGGDPDAGPGSDRQTVEPGDHLWALAEARLADHLGRAVTDQEIAPYWQRVVDSNPQLTDPDLVFPGDVIRLPAPD